MQPYFLVSKGKNNKNQPKGKKKKFMGGEKHFLKSLSLQLLSLTGRLGEMAQPTEPRKILSRYPAYFRYLFQPHQVRWKGSS